MSSFTSCFVDDIKTLRNVWLVGDEFLKTNYNPLCDMRKKALRMGKHMPYLYKNYNISGYWINQFDGITSPIRRIINSLIKAINSGEDLPRIIIITIDDEILRRAQYYNFGSSKILGTVINYLVKNITNLIETRKTDIRAIRTGATIEGEPKIIWTRIPFKPHKEKLLNLRNKYNAILEETLACFKACYMVEIEGLENEDYDFTNKLCAKGPNHFWHKFDKIIRQFDHNKDDFLDRKVITNANLKQKSKEPRFILPRPPKNL